MRTKVTNEQILKAIHAVRRRNPGKLIRGREVRRYLRRKYKTIANTARVYRLLVEVVTPPDPDDRKIASARQLKYWRRRAELAETREEAHAKLWATKIDELRIQLLDAERRSLTQPKPSEALLDAHRKLRAQRERISDQESYIRALEDILKQHEIALPVRNVTEYPSYGTPGDT